MRVIEPNLCVAHFASHTLQATRTNLTGVIEICALDGQIRRLAKSPFGEASRAQSGQLSESSPRSDYFCGCPCGLGRQSFDHYFLEKVASLYRWLDWMRSLAWRIYKLLLLLTSCDDRIKNVNPKSQIVELVLWLSTVKLVLLLSYFVALICFKFAQFRIDGQIWSVRTTQTDPIVALSTLSRFGYLSSSPEWLDGAFSYWHFRLAEYINRNLVCQVNYDQIIMIIQSEILEFQDSLKRGKLVGNDNN